MYLWRLTLSLLNRSQNMFVHVRKRFHSHGRGVVGVVCLSCGPIRMASAIVLCAGISVLRLIHNTAVS